MSSPGEQLSELAQNFLRETTPADRLRAAADLFEERNEVYSDGYKRIGALVIALFPEGGVPAMTTAEEVTRFAHLLLAVTKLHRYAHNFNKGGHPDSARDLQVYAAMLEEACSFK